MVVITVLSWNLFWALGYPTGELSRAKKAITYFRQRNDRKELLAITDVIKKNNADIVGLQEIDDGSRRNGQYSHRTFIQQHTPLHYSAYAADRTWLAYCNDGNAVFSTKPLHNIQRVTLPYRMEKRVAIISTIRIGKRAIDVYVTHFGAHKTNKKERCAQARAIRDRIKKLKRPAIVMGDLNCEPDDEEFKILCDNTLHHLPHAPSYPAFRPTKRYDHILCTADLKIIKCKTLSVRHSDHLPVLATIEVTP